MKPMELRSTSAMAIGARNFIVKIIHLRTNPFIAIEPPFVSSSRTSAFFILHPTNITTRRPPTGGRMFEEV